MTDQMNSGETNRSLSRGKGMPSLGYRRKKDTGTWHWHPNCSDWPTKDFFTRERKPEPLNGKLCKECKDRHK